MIDKVVLGTMTMRAGLGIPGSTIRWALNNQFKEFKKVVVIDGDMTPEAKAFYAKFPNVLAIDSPWKDSYVTQYRRFADELKNEEWGLWLDDDEICSPELLRGLSRQVTTFLDSGIVKIPCVLHLTDDEKNSFPAEPQPGWIVMTQGFGQPPGQWTKSILFKKAPGLDFRWFGSHVIPMNSKMREEYIPTPYYHMKSLESFVYNDVWQAFLSPEGQGYTAVEASKFRILTAQYKNTKDFKHATKNGLWNPALKKFAWDNRTLYNRPISRLAWVYFILEKHSMPESDSFMDWNNVKQFVLSEESMKIYSEAKQKNLGIVVDASEIL
jgi:hypothetical protein